MNFRTSAATADSNALIGLRPVLADSCLLGRGFFLSTYFESPFLGNGACLVYLDVVAVYADVLQVGALTKFMEDSLDQTAFRLNLESLVHRATVRMLRLIAPSRAAAGNP